MGGRDNIGVSSHGGVVGRGSGNDDNEGGESTTATTIGEDFDGRASDGTIEFRDGRVDDDDDESEMQLRRELQIRQEGERRRQREIEEQRQQQQQRARLAEQRRAEEQKRLEETKRSPRDKLRIILTDFATAAKSSAESVSRLRIRRDDLRSDEIAAEKAARLAARQVLRAEQLQSAAVAEEDFDRADGLASVIDAHSREHREGLERCGEIARALERTEGERVEAARGMVECFKGVWEKLKELEAEQLGRRKEDGTDVSYFLMWAVAAQVVLRFLWRHIYNGTFMSIFRYWIDLRPRPNDFLQRRID